MIDLGGADSFLRGVFGDAAPEIDRRRRAPVGHAAAGSRFGGGLGLEVVLPIDRDVGPAPRRLAHARAGRGDDGRPPRGDGRRGLTIGPFAAPSTGIGAALDLTAGGGLGGLDAAARVRAADARSASRSTSARSARAAASSTIDPEIGRYAGALALDLLAVGLGAIVVVDTQLPDDPDGWALFASLFATFPSLPLGFGFFLSGVGGLVCLNRTMDAEAIAGGLKSGAVDAILFPDDPSKTPS